MLRRAHLVLGCCLSLLPGRAATQNARIQNAQVTIAARGDSVRLFTTSVPAGAFGFLVSRGDSTGPLTRITAEPVMALASSPLFVAALGSDLQDVMRATATSDELALLRRLQRDPFAANYLGYLYPRVAVALGRTWGEGGRERGRLYRYRVDFVDASGRPTGQSATTQVRIADVLPTPPTGLRVTGSDLGVDLSWSYPAHRGDAADVSYGYHVYRAAGSDSLTRLTPAPLLRDENRKPEYFDSNVRAGTSYRYAIRAIDILGREGAPIEARFTVADTTAPQPPDDLTAQSGNGWVKLVWPMAPDLDARGYFVERSVGLDKPYTRLTPSALPADLPTFTDSTARAGTQYFYRILVVDSAGNLGPASNPATALPIDRVAPNAPTGLRLTLQPGRRVRVDWTASTAKDLAGYFVYRAYGQDAPLRLTATPIAQASYLDIGPDSIGLQPGQRYRFGLSAIDQAENESPRITAEIIVPDDDPPLPASGLTTENQHGRFVRITWGRSPSQDATLYHLERESRGGSTTLGRFKPAALPQVTDSALVLGQVYVYRLTVIDTAGNRSKPIVDTLVFRDPTPPPAPRHAAAKATTNGVQITWERVIDSDLAGYMVFRSTLPTGVFEPVTKTPVKELTFTDRASPPGAYYVVRAVDSSGNESRSSPVATVPAR
jgi:fibronectin type 3 domain-containing protein